MSTPSSSRPVTGAAFTLEALESRLLLSATALPALDPIQANPGSTSTQALAAVGHAEFLASAPAQQEAAPTLFASLTDSPRLTLVSATLKSYEGQDSTVFGTSDLLTQVVIGDGSGATVHLPGQNTLIQADWVDVSSPLSAENLVIAGDGTTVKLNNTVTSLTNIINDAVEVSGNFGQSPVRFITSTAGVLTINGSLNGDNHAGALAPVNQNAGPDDVVLNATGAIFIRDAVGGFALNGLRHVSINILPGVGVGNVTFNDTVTLDGNLYIKKGQDVSFLRNVVVTGDLVIEEAADVRFDGTLTVGGSLRIIKANNVTFSNNVSVTGDVTIGRPDVLANIGSVAFTSSARFDFGGQAGIFANGALVFGNNIGQSALLRPDSFTLATGSTITFSASASVLLDATTPFVITQATDISFGANIVSGNVTIGRTTLVTGNINFTGSSINVQSFDVTTSGALGRVTIATVFQVGTGDATITANEINFGPSASLSSNGGYASVLNLKPYTVSRIIGIGTSPQGVPGDINLRLDINSDDLKAIQPGFGAVIIGDLQAGTGDVFVGAIGSIHTVSQLLNRTVIAGGAITLTQNLDVATGVDYLRLVARTGNITVNGVVNRGAPNGSNLANQAFEERNPWVRLEAANDIIVNRAIYAASRVSLSAGTDGTGNIVINSTGANSGSIETITAIGGDRRIELIAGATAGDITLTDDVAAITLRAAGASSSIVLRAAAGAISQTGGLLVADTLSVWSRDSVGLRTDVNRIDSQTLKGDVLPGGTGAAITAKTAGLVSNIIITNGGSGYTSAPTVVLSAPPAGGTLATATATVVGGFVTGITITNPGAGYLTAPTVSFSGGGGGSGAAAISLVTPGTVTSLALDSNGTGFTAVPTLTILGDGRTVATGSATIRGVVGSYLVTSGGSSYTAIALDLLGGATASGPINVINGQLTAATVGAAGAGYAAAPLVSISGNGTGAAVIANLAASLFTVSRTPGSGYNYIPTVVVSGGAADQVVNGLQITGGGSVSIVNSGALIVANATITPDSGSTRGSLAFTTLAGNLTLGYLNASTGAITLTAAGAIVDATPADDAVPNVVTTGLVTFDAGTGIGAVGDSDIDITAGSLQATNSTSGNIVIQHAGLVGTTITGTGVRALGGNGSVNIQSNPINSNTATLTVAAPVAAHGTGSVRLEATGTLSDVALSTATADISSGSGPITVVANRNLTTVADTRITTGGGAIYLEGITGVFTMADDSLASSGGGNIRARSQLTVTLGGLNAAAGSASVISTAGSILDAGETHKNITAGATRLSAFSSANSIGTATNALEIASGTLSASASTGGITLVEDDDVSVTSVSVATTVVTLAGTTSTVTDAALADLATVTNGSISLSTVAGSITLIDGDADNFAVSANGTGRVFLSAGGATSDVLAQSDILSGTGAISVFAGRTIDFTAGSDVTTLNNSVDLEATAGSVTQADTAVVSTGTGSIRAKAGLDVTVASFNAGTVGKISIDAGRSILDGGSTHVDLIASAARLKAGTAAGATTDALETTLDTLSALAGSGGININETNALVIDAVTVTVNRVSADPTTTTPLTDAAQADLVTTSNGPIKVVTGGDLTLNKGDADDEVIDADGSGTITLETTGVITMTDGTIARTGTGDVSFTATGNILLSIVTSTSGNFTITSGSGSSVSGAISDNLTGEAANLRTSGLVALDAETGVGNTGTADIDTDVGSITARNRTSGNIVIEEADAITVAAAGLVNNVAAAHIILSSLAGTITVSGPVTATGSGNIRLSAAGASSDIIGSTAISTGINGNVTLLAARNLTLNTGASVAVLGNGTLDLEATAGSILFADAVAGTTGGGNIRLLAANDVTLTGLNAGTGSITVQATNGSIIDAGETLTDLTASAARLTAAIGIGAAGALESTVSSLAASATTGGIRVANTISLSVTSVPVVSVKRVALDGTTGTTVGDSAALTDLQATTGLVELSSGGTLTLTDGSDADTRAVETTTGEIKLSAVNNVIFQASVVSTSGDITAASSAGALVDDTVSEAALVITTGLATLNAKTGVGTSGAGDIDTTIGSIRGILTTSGGFFVEETDTLIVNADGIVTQGGNAPVSLVTTTGNLTVSGVITAHGSGNIHVNTKSGTAKVDAVVSSTSGHVTFLASGDITLNANIASGLTGTLNVVSSGGSITQLNGTRIITGSGDIRVLANGSIALASVSTTGNASVTATTGAITDAGETHVDVIASAARLQAGTAIATAGDHLETTVATLSARADAGGIYILESDGVTVTTTSSTVQVVLADATALTTASEGNQSDITTAGANGQIILESTTGDIVLNDGTAPAGGNAVVAHGSGSILLDALAGNLIANADIRSTTGQVTLKADDNIELNANVDVQTGTPGTISINAETGTLTMAGSANVTATGSSARLRAESHITVGNVTATNVSIDSDAGDIINAAGSTKNVTGTNLRIQAQGSVGVPTRHLTTNVDVLTALASTGSIYITEDNGVTVQNVGVTVTEFTTTAGTLDVVDADQSDLITGATSNGNIVLVALAGNITLNDGTATSTDKTVTANGTGNILIEAAAGTITANADITTGTGHVTLSAAQSISLTANVDVTTTVDGTLDLLATAGNLVMATTATLNTVNGDIRITVGDGATDQVVIGDITASNANVSIETPGLVIDADPATSSTVDDTDTDVTAKGLRIVAGKGVGLLSGNSLSADTNAIETAIETLAVQVNGSNGINIIEDNALTIGNVISPKDAGFSATVQTVNRDATTTKNDEARQSDVVTTAGNGSIVIKTESGTLTITDGLYPAGTAAVTAHGTGNILLWAEGAGTDIVVQTEADIDSGSGHITLSAAQTINLGTGVDVTTTTDGTIDILAGTGDLLSTPTSTINTVNGDIRITVGDAATDRVQLGDITASNANVSIETPGLVIDADPATSSTVDDTDTDVTAKGLRIVAGKGVGLLSGNSLSADTNAIETAIETLAVQVNGSNGINIIEDNALTIGNVISPKDAGFSATVQTVNRDATTTKNDEARQSDVVTTAGNGSIVIKTETGTLTITDGLYPAGTAAVTAHGTGNILLWAEGAGTDIVVQTEADIDSGSGHITLSAAQTINLGTGVDVTTTTDGTIDILAGTGDLLSTPTSTINTVNGDIRITVGDAATDRVQLGDITASNANVSIETPGLVIDADPATSSTVDDTDTDVTAKGLRIVAGKGVGLLSGNSLSADTNAIETAIETLAVQVNGSNGINIIEDNALTIGNVISPKDAGFSATVQTVNRDATTTKNDEARQSDVVTTAGNGSIVIKTETGTLTITDGLYPAGTAAVTAHGSGNILLWAEGSGTDIVVQTEADIDSTTGHITLKAARNIDLNSSVDVTTGTAGTVSIDAQTGALTMAGTATVTATSSSARLRAQGDITVGNVTATNVSIDSDNGSIINAAGSTKNVTAANLRLQAQGSIGASDRHLTTNIDTVTALATTGSIYVTEDNGATVANVGVTVQDVTRSAQLSAVTDADQSDLTTASGSNGNIVLVATLGDITLNDGTAPSGGNAVLADGSGNILIDAVAGNLIANADLRSTTGHITLKADDNIELNANVDVQTGTPGTISLDAETGTLTMLGSANVTATSSSARLRAQGNITVGNVTATNVSIDSDAGSIINAAASTKNVTVTNLRLQAQGSIGVAGRHITTNIDNLTALASTGSLYITEDAGVTVGNVSVSVTEFTSVAGTSAVNDAAQSDLTTGATSNGNIVLVATTGDITLNDGPATAVGTTVSANGSGSILIDALVGNLTANADILSGTGRITLKAGTDLTLTSGVDVTTATAGTISIDAETGALVMAGTANVTATSSSARLRAEGDITVGNITATNVSIDSDAGSIINAAGSTKNVTATNLRLQAEVSIGASDRHLTTNITNLSALASTGSLYVTEDNEVTVGNVTVTVTDFTSTAGTSNVTDALQSDLTTGSNGNIVLVATLGDITLNDGPATAAGIAVSANGSGNILLQAAAGAITANADILSGTGHVTVLGQTNVLFTATADLGTSGPGTVYVSGVTGTVTQADDSRFSSFAGDIRVVATGNITVGGITTSANVSLVSSTGSILDAGDAFGGADIVAAGLRMTTTAASTSIGGVATPLELTVATLAARSTGGGIYLRETDAITLATVAATVQQVGTGARLTPVTDSTLAGVQTTGGNGVIDIRTTAGNIGVANDSSSNGSGQITLIANGTTGNIVFGAVLSSTTGNITLTSGARIRETTTTETPVIATGGVLTLSAVTGIGETGRGDLDLSVPSLSFSNSGVGQAYIKSHLGAATLTSATLAGAGSLIFTQVVGGFSINGPVVVTAGSATFRVPGALTLSSASLTTSEDLTLIAQSLGATATGLTAGATGTLSVATSGNASLDATSPLNAGSVTISTGGTLALGQVNATDLLDIQATGSITTSSASTSLVVGQLRIATAADAGTTALPLRVSAGSSDIQVGGVSTIVNLNSLTLGRAGMAFNTTGGNEQVITVQGSTIGSLGGQVIDNGTGTLRIEAPSGLTLATQIISNSGNITINSQTLTDGTADEGFLLNAPNGRVTLNTQTGIGGTAAGADLEFVAAQIQATTQTGNIQLESLGSTTVAGTGLVIASAGATGAIALTTSSGNLSVAAPVTNTGSGSITLAVPAGTLTMGTGGVVTSNVGAVTMSSSGLMTLNRVVSTTGLISLSTSNAITSLAALNYANVSSLTRPNITVVNYVKIIVDASSVFATGPRRPTGININRGGSSFIDMSIYSFLLTGNNPPA